MRGGRGQEGFQKKELGEVRHLLWHKKKRIQRHGVHSRGVSQRMLGRVVAKSGMEKDDGLGSKVEWQ